MKTVMVFGTFDILHAGHIALFKEARKYGDKLIAVVGRDSTVKMVKKNKPYHNETERKNFLEHIDLIDKVMLGDKKDRMAVIKQVRPDVIALGYDQTAFVDLLETLPFKVKIVRLKPFKPNKFKSQKIKDYLLRTI